MFKGGPFDRSVVLLCVRWYLAYSLSLRELEEMTIEQGNSIDHATVHRWVIRHSSELLNRFNTPKRSVSGEWHLDEPIHQGPRALDGPLPCRRRSERRPKQ